MKLKSSHVSLIVLICVLGGIGTAAALGLWATTTDKVPGVYTEGEAAGKANPADIKGSYTFGDIEKAFGISADVLAQAFEIPEPEKAASFTVKDLESIYADDAAAGTEIGTGSVRYFVALYKGLPFEIDEVTYLPSAAVQLLKADAPLSEAQKTDLDGIALGVAGDAAPIPPVIPTENQPPALPAEPADEEKNTPSPTEQEKVAGTVKGSTTFNDLIDWGLSPEEIQSVIGTPAPSGSMTIKSYSEEKGVEFSTYKTAFQDLLDTLNE